MRGKKAKNMTAKEKEIEKEISDLKTIAKEIKRLTQIEREKGIGLDTEFYNEYGIERPRRPIEE